MKKLLFFSALIILLSSGQKLWSQKSPVKDADLSEFTLNGNRSQQIFGQFNDLTPDFSRASDYYNETCHEAEIIYDGFFKYEVHTIKANTDGFLVLTLESPAGDYKCTNDMFVYCYCHPFDPSDALANYYAENDDGGIDYNSAITPDDEVQLQAGQYYDIVCTHFCPFVSDELPQDYVLTIDSDVTIGGPVPNPLPLSNWALGIGIFLILTFAVIRIKRFS